MNIIKQFQIGSRYFFKDFPDFKSKDNDILCLVDEMPKEGRKTYTICKDGIHATYMPISLTKEDHIRLILNIGQGLRIGHFLEKEWAEYIGFTVNELWILRPLVAKLDYKHLYFKDIYEAILENKSFDLTQEQLEKAYKTYKEARTLWQDELI